jgi:L-asparaginase
MIKNIYTILILCSVLLIGAKKNIIIVGTGGGITSRQVSASNSKFSQNYLTIDGLLGIIPGIQNIANIKSDEMMNKKSQNIDTESLLKIARRVNKHANNPSIYGIIVTHGTDTMEETAYFLNLVIKTDKPIVVTGATRPSNHMSSDAFSNLLDATVVASNKQSRGKGVLVVMNSKVFSARGAKKLGTNFTDSINTLDSGLIGHVLNKKVFMYQKSTKTHTYNSAFNIKSIKKLPYVPILYAHAQINPKIVTAILKSKPSGIVIAGVGNGNISDAILNKIVEHNKKAKPKVVIVKSSRTGSGPVLPAIEVNDAKLGFVTANNLSPQQARILLRAALTKTRRPSVIQTYFDTY